MQDGVLKEMSNSERLCARVCTRRYVCVWMGGFRSSFLYLSCRSFRACLSSRSLFADTHTHTLSLSPSLSL